MDLGDTTALQAQASLTVSNSVPGLTHVLDSHTISTYTVSSVNSSAGYAVLTPALDGNHSTVTSLPGFALSSFDTVDVVSSKHDQHELAVATVGVDGRFVDVLVIRSNDR